MPYDLRTPEEVFEDELKEIHDMEHYAEPHPRCWRCEERAAHLCACGHDLADEHRPIPDAYDTGETYLLCDAEDCDCSCIKGEREAYEAKVREINALALPKVEAAVKEYLKK